MTEPGKYAPGLKGFPTPDAAADIAAYLLLLFPDQEWSQYALGALKTLTAEYNWYKSGSLDPAEAAEAFRAIVQDGPYNLRVCGNPDGGRIIRVSSSGRVEEYGDAGEWTDPTGDYAIPPVPERTGGTPEDQICLAAKNATNVLQQLYENITDSFTAGLSEAEALTALALGGAALIGIEFAPITLSIVTFFGWLFGVLYETLAFVGADLWESNFTSALICILRDCATNTDGVVTFDWDCFQAALAAQVNLFDLTFAQLRLFGQLQYLLAVVGGVDALNAAGATTAITDADCDDICGAPCADKTEPFTTAPQAFTTIADTSYTINNGGRYGGVFSPTGGLTTGCAEGNSLSPFTDASQVSVTIDMGKGCDISFTQMYWKAGGELLNVYISYYAPDGTFQGGHNQTQHGTGTWQTWADTGGHSDTRYITFAVVADPGDTPLIDDISVAI